MQLSEGTVDLMPAHRKPPGTRVDNRPQRDRSLAAVPDQADEPDIPAPPPGTLAPSKAWWADFWQSPQAKSMTPVHLPVLERLVWCYDELARTQRVVRKARVVKGSQGQPVANPLIGYLSGLQKEIRSLEAELGIGLKSASNLGIAMGVEALTAQKLNEMAEEGADADEEGGGFIDTTGHEEAELLEGFGEAR